ncbi:hypothetical protein P3L10_032114 [Capsicum annuum]
MPLPPQNWPRNERQLQSSNSSKTDLQDIKALSDFSESEDQLKHCRGPTMMHSGWGKDGGNLHIELNEYDQVIRPERPR